MVHANNLAMLRNHAEDKFCLSEAFNEPELEQSCFVIPVRDARKTVITKANGRRKNHEGQHLLKKIRVYKNMF